MGEIIRVFRRHLLTVHADQKCSSCYRRTGFRVPLIIVFLCSNSEFSELSVVENTMNLTTEGTEGEQRD